MSEIVKDGLYFGEAPRWRDGRLWYSDFFARSVHALTPGGDDEVVVELDDEPSGLGWLPDGRLLVVAMRSHRLLAVDAAGVPEPYADVSPFAAHRSNDLLVSDSGQAYIGNFGFDDEAYRRHGGPVPTSLTRVDPAGTVSEAASDLLFPNGMVTTQEGRTLVVAETYASRLTAFSVAADGSLSGRRVWADLSGSVPYPDGICVDADDAVWVASASQPRCVRVAEGGEVLQVAAFSQNCFACALGDDDGTTLYAMTAPTSEPTVASAARKGRIEAVAVSVPGQASDRHEGRRT